MRKTVSCIIFFPLPPFATFIWVNEETGEMHRFASYESFVAHHRRYASHVYACLPS